MTWTLANPTTDKNNPRRILVRDGIRQFCPFQQDQDGNSPVWCGSWCPHFEEEHDLEQVSPTELLKYHVVQISCSGIYITRTLEDHNIVEKKA